MPSLLAKKKHQAGQYIKYLTLAKSIHKVHPPFAFDFYKNILKKDMPLQEEKTIKQIKARGKRNQNVIEHTDMGAGSGTRKYKRNHKRVSEIVKSTAIPHKYGRILFNLVKHYQPKNILEFGTATGMSTLYLALSKPQDSKIITLEGCEETATVARSNFKKTNAKGIEILTGDFALVLPVAMQKLSQIDMVYIDGNHVKKPTLEYFKTLLNQIHNDTIIVFDDVHWSNEMTEAWNTIQKNDNVTLSIDLFKMGIVFFKKELAKQHLILRY